MTITIVAAFAVALVAILLVVGGEIALYRKNQQLQRQLAAARQPPFTPPLPRESAESAEKEHEEHLEKQLQDVMRETVNFSAIRVMRRGEYNVFRAALSVTRQPRPSGTYPFYVFPQVSLGQIIQTDAPFGLGWQAEAAHRAINSKRCDLLIADLYGNPVAVLEYQGPDHNIGGTAEKRDRIKRIALERAGVRFVEIKDGATQSEIQQTIRDVMTRMPA
jgi:hypothetical protein